MCNLSWMATEETAPIRTALVLVILSSITFKKAQKVQEDVINASDNHGGGGFKVFAFVFVQPCSASTYAGSVHASHAPPPS